MERLVCHDCQKEYPLASSHFRCTCGGLLDFQEDWPPVDPIAAGDGEGLWRFRAALPFGGAEDRALVASVSLGEGGTPLLPAGGAEPQLWLKADYYMPTLSFKDRGAVMLALAAKKFAFQEIAIDSSGNAACALAAYAARAGLTCHVFVPASASAAKLRQIRAHGAVLHAISGHRSDVAAAAMAAVTENNWYYASHVYNPLFYQGTKTYFWEILAQCAQRGVQPPQVYILPVGNGTLLLGAYQAFHELIHWGLLERFPHVVAVQAAACAPLYAAWRQGASVPLQITAEETVAEGIAIAAPPRGRQILAALREMNGEMVVVEDDAILAARADLAARGIYVEKTSAANYAAYRQLLACRPEFAKSRVVLPLCGAGIKSD